MLVTSDENIAVSDLMKKLADKREFAARNMTGLARYLHKRHGTVPVVSLGTSGKVEVTYDGLQWTIRDIR